MQGHRTAYALFEKKNRPFLRMGGGERGGYPFTAAISFRLSLAGLDSLRQQWK